MKVKFFNNIFKGINFKDEQYPLMFSWHNKRYFGSGIYNFKYFGSYL
jgi:hypothetical protein